MVGISLIASIILVIVLLFYKFVFRKNINYLTLIILISLLPIISIFRPGSYESGDLSVHTAYGMAFYSSLSEGNLVPNWAGDFNGRYGYPLFGFSYILPYYLSSLFHFVGFNFISSTKFVLGLAFIVSGISMYLYAREEFRKKYQAAAAAIFYLFAPYHLIDLHFRVDIGEVVAFIFIPLVFLFAKKISVEPVFKWVLIEALSIFLLIISHQAISLSVIPFLFIYSVFLFRKKIFPILFSITLGLAISLFYWLPILVEKQFTHSSMESISFSPISYLLFSPWRYGFLFQGPHGELSFPIGYIHILLILFASILVFFKKIEKKETKKTILLISFTLVSVFLIIPLSGFFWDSIPFIKNFQFSYRMMGTVVFFSAYLSAISIKYIPWKSIIFILCITAIGTTILNWGNRKTVPVTENQIYNSIIHDGIGLTPALPKWIKDWFKDSPGKIEVIKGEGILRETARNMTKHEYKVEAKSDLELKENTSYFPGWTAKLDGKNISINYENPKHSGIITIKVPKGKHLLKLQLLDTPVRLFSKLASFFILLTLFFFFIFHKTKIIIGKKEIKRPKK